MARGDSVPVRGDPNQLPELLRTFERIKVKVETMTGERGDETKSLSSVRRSELRPLASMEMRSSQITAAPTQAQYNALQSDVADIFNSLKRISNLLGNATIPKV